MEAAAIGVVFTWGTTFACQLRLRLLTDRGVIQASTFPMPGSPWTSIVGLVFLALVIVGLGLSGRQSALYFWHKTAFLVVVLGIPVITLMLWVGLADRAAKSGGAHRRPDEVGMDRAGTAVWRTPAPAPGIQSVRPSHRRPRSHWSVRRSAPPGSGGGC